MSEPFKPKPRRRLSLFRRPTLILMSLGITSEMVAVTGMVLGVFAGVAFMSSGELAHPTIAWGVGLALCLLRMITIQLDGMLQPTSTRQSREDEFYNELPERVSDAVTLIGFGFAVDSNPWLGLVAALVAIFSAYIRSLATNRLVARPRGGMVLMTRTQRLLLLSLASALMIREFSPGFEIPRVTLLIVIAGCLFTVSHRWVLLRGIKV